MLHITFLFKSCYLAYGLPYKCGSSFIIKINNFFLFCTKIQIWLSEFRFDVLPVLLDYFNLEITGLLGALLMDF